MGTKYFLRQAPTPNILLDATVGVNGYLVQFNPLYPASTPTTPGTMGSYSCWNYGTSSTTSYDTSNYNNTTQTCASSAAQIPSSQVILWQAQVAVKLPAGSDMVQMKNRLGADCISSPGASAGSVTPCSANPTAGYYLVWDRMPSLASSQQTSGFWQGMQTVQQFTQQYTHDPMYELYYPSAASGNTWPTPTTGAPAIQPYVNSPPYYLCGG